MKIFARYNDMKNKLYNTTYRTLLFTFIWLKIYLHMCSIHVSVCAPRKQPVKTLIRLLTVLSAKGSRMQRGSRRGDFSFLFHLLLVCLIFFNKHVFKDDKNTLYYRKSKYLISYPIQPVPVYFSKCVCTNIYTNENELYSVTSFQSFVPLRYSYIAYLNFLFLTTTHSKNYILRKVKSNHPGPHLPYVYT